MAGWASLFSDFAKSCDANGGSPSEGLGKPSAKYVLSFFVFFVISRRASNASVAVRKKSCTRIDSSARVTAWLGADNTRHRPAASIFFRQ